MENVGNPHAIRLESEVRNRYQKLKDEQQRIQIKTFTNWINAQLNYNGNSTRRVTDLLNDIKDGAVLIQVLESLTNSKLTKSRPNSSRRPLQISNVSTSLEYLKKRGVRLVNINCSDIVDGKPSIVLGLVWKIILHLQIQDSLSREVKRTNGHSIGNLLKGSLYDSPQLETKDFGPSWRSGEMFNNLINTIKPGAIDTELIQPENVRETLQTAFKVAETELDIPRLLDPEDVDVERPDEMSIITYVGQFVSKYPNDVGNTLKQKLLHRAERLNGSPSKPLSRSNSNNVVTTEPITTPSRRIIPYAFVFILVLLYRFIWYIVFLFLVHNTLFG